LLRCRPLERQIFVGLISYSLDLFQKMPVFGVGGASQDMSFNWTLAPLFSWNFALSFAIALLFAGGASRS